ncbi:phenylacetic acid degradation operon negative regulatory protein PaaX [Acidocella sp.]|uniref:phenylacetic acid degradation operon negative regulatory protein PaaX n=1 Tax=Acidocella sp. TaxID=50710 RepID=UPI002620DA96|nr:phenylacetic acid degradation operon negative regulatory protein PaaX [Acidocella sp.]
MSPPPLETILGHVRAEPSRTWSIIVSFFGDAIVPRGGTVWLGTLLGFFKGLEVAETVVRSAMSRLAAEEWLTRTRQGRNSFYHLAERGRETFAGAALRIYHHRPPAWTGAFEALLVEPAAREAVREALDLAGFGVPLPGIFVAPGGAPIPAAAAGLLRLSLTGTPTAQRELAAKAWKLDELGAAYARFCAVFGPLGAALAQGARLSPLEAIMARVLLIHEYRRIVLRDPVLPPPILPAPWPGDEARHLCAGLYRHLLAPSERWLDQHAIGENGAPLPANPEIASRFND